MADANELKQRATSSIDGRRDELIALSLKIHANPEIAFEEVESSALIADYLEDNGFLVDRGVSELPTAFSASYAPAVQWLRSSANTMRSRGSGTAAGTTSSVRRRAPPASRFEN